jgi:hypothetical protein
MRNRINLREHSRFLFWDAIRPYRADAKNGATLTAMDDDDLQSAADKFADAVAQQGHGQDADSLREAAEELIKAAAAAGVHGYAIEGYLCPECGGAANICVSPPGPDADVAGHRSGDQAGAEILLICQGPLDPDTLEDDPRWDHSGQIVTDLVATGYEPIGLN